MPTAAAATVPLNTPVGSSLVSGSPAASNWFQSPLTPTASALGAHTRKVMPPPGLGVAPSDGGSDCGGDGEVALSLAPPSFGRPVQGGPASGTSELPHATKRRAHEIRMRMAHLRGVSNSKLSQLPVNLGGRFSLKARRASRASAE